MALKPTQRDFLKRLGISVRRRLPETARHMLRLGRHLVAKGQTSAWIPAELLADCSVCASRNDLIRLLPRQSRIAEIGTYRGEFARRVLDMCDPTRLDLVDLDFSLLDPAVANDVRVVMHNGASNDVLALFPNDHFDWIYIDADHSYDGVSSDANAAASKVKPGGYLVFNDFAHMDPFLGAYGVHRAVVDFAIAREWSFAWFVYDPNALYDVALRRP